MTIIFRNKYELAAERRQGINKAVADDVQKVFVGKTAAQLAALQRNIEAKLRKGEDGLDISYWESLLSQLKAHLARARLRDKHKENLRKKLEVLKAEQAMPGPTEDSPAPLAHDEVKQEEEESPQAGTSAMADTAEGAEAAAPQSADDDEEEDAAAAYARGGYSPRYLTQDDLDLGTLVITADEDAARRESDRRAVLRGGKVDNVMNAEEKALEREAKKGMNDDEASFAVESALEQTYEWSDKHRPRKPRYFNRVHTGFEWNKYNQTH